MRDEEIAEFLRALHAGSRSELERRTPDDEARAEALVARLKPMSFADLAAHCDRVLKEIT